MDISSDTPLSMRPKTALKRVRLPDNHDERWNQAFAVDREHPPNDELFIQTSRERLIAEGLQAEGDDLQLFLSNSAGLVPSCEEEDIRSFCSGVALPRENSISTVHVLPGIAWLDDREKGSGNTRPSTGLLTAIELGQSLRRPRFGAQDYPNADRRLIYIPDLTAEYVLVLAGTASAHQAEALRNAIWKYLTLQTSIRVHIPTMGFITFRLEFHVPYYAYRRQAATAGQASEARRAINTRREWTNLSFLVSDTATRMSNCDIGIFEAMISVVLCGFDDSRWVAYAFVDTGFDELDSGECMGETEYNEDPIASDRRGPEVEADRPIWPPREYFLRIVDLRMKQILEEWRYLVGVVDRSLKVRRTAHPVALFRQSDSATSEYIRVESDWTIRTMDLLRRLRERFSKTFEAWERFNNSDGDIGYFVKAPGRASNLALNGIKETFQELMDLEGRLRFLDDSCNRDCKILELRMNFESNRVTHETRIVALQTQKTAQETSQTARLTLSMNLQVASITIVMGYFSTPEAIFHFDRNPRSFVLAVAVVMVIIYLVNRVMVLADRHSFWEWLKSQTVKAFVKRRIADRTRQLTNAA